jgi:uncharacterized protein (TIGR04168 family)
MELPQPDAPHPTPHTPEVSKVAVVGDVHLLWDRFDADYFNRSDYGLVLFVGDIAAYRHGAALPIARSIAELRMPAIVMPGNHDAVHLGQLIAEVLDRPTLSDRIAFGQPRRSRQLDRALGGVALAGYSRHTIELGNERLSVVAARPHSMGGPRVSFRRYLRAAHDVDSLEASTDRLKALVDQCGDEPILFLGHNGPTGFGDRRDDPWGCDFRPGEGDFGDPDLAGAIAYARASGRRVLGVVAGHMHHELKGGGRRRWLEHRDDTFYLNAARVPRIFRDEGRVVHHHVELAIDNDGALVRERLIPRDPDAG